MAKKKKKAAVVQAPIKDKNYLSSGRARSLPLSTCLVNTDWEKEGMAEIFVTRKHANGHLTVGVYLVDTFCTGLKNTFYYFNMEAFEFQELLDSIPLDTEEIPYELAHNIIYGAIAFAQDYGIEPHAEFKLTQMILEEDTEDVELIELEFGKDGQPHLVISPNGDPRAEHYLRQLERHAGPGSYTVLDGRLVDFEEPYEDDFDDPKDWDADDWAYFIENTSPDDLHKEIDAAVYMFDKLVSEPTRATKLLTSETKTADFAISFETEPANFSEEEQEEIKQIIEIVDEGELDLLEQTRDRVLEDMAKWPQDPYFHQLLITVHMELEDEEETYNAILEFYRKFPDELKSKILYAQTLLDEDRTAEALEVFGGHYTLQGVYPERDMFYISELVDFNTIMAQYFLKIHDLQQARIYVQMLEQIDLPMNAIPDFETLLEVDLAIVEEMKDILREAQQNETKKQELVAQLVK